MAQIFIPLPGEFPKPVIARGLRPRGNLSAVLDFGHPIVVIAVEAKHPEQHGCLDCHGASGPPAMTRREWDNGGKQKKGLAKGQPLERSPWAYYCFCVGALLTTLPLPLHCITPLLNAIELEVVSPLGPLL